jgi:hypothetical protein
MRSAGPVASSSREGLASSPRSTNNPIWAREAMPSAKPTLAARWGNDALPNASPQRKTATNPEVWASDATAKASTHRASVASG